MESPATRSAKCVAGRRRSSSGTARYSSTCSAASTGAPAAIRPTSGHASTAVRLSARTSVIARGFVGSLWRRPLRSRLASWAWTLEEDGQADRLADLPDGGGVAAVPHGLGDEVQDALLER